MKTFTFCFLCMMVPLATSGQGSSQPPVKKPAPAVSAHASTAPAKAHSAAGTAQKTDPAKEAAIRELFEVQGVTNLSQQMTKGMINNVRPTLVNSLPPGEYREKLVELFFQKFQSKMNTARLLELMIPIYDKHFSKDEIQGLTQFYKTPLGRKVLAELPQVAIESQNESMKMGEEVSRESMLEVLAEHPDLGKNLEEAASSNNTASPAKP